jgi:hypothetical protein
VIEYSVGFILRELGRRLTDCEQRPRDVLRFPQHAVVEVVLPPERHDAPLAGKAVKLEVLERQPLNVRA